MRQGELGAALLNHLPMVIFPSYLVVPPSIWTSERETSFKVGILTCFTVLELVSGTYSCPSILNPEKAVCAVTGLPAKTNLKTHQSKILFHIDQRRRMQNAWTLVSLLLLPKKQISYIKDFPDIPDQSKSLILCCELTTNAKALRLAGNSASCTTLLLGAKRYRDPKTGLPYATKEAFRIIRERFSEENNRGPKKMDMGVLFDSISAQGFSGRRKRSLTSKKNETSYFRYLARFRTIPVLEIEDSD
ncbi:SWR1 complex subunit 2 [Vitis vinifera]|uniref:SWR1 complex subunit 2 n=1 Tax=Vitis vinifera TaxID=29760 RepID=A0A438CBA4_VITVI|nr:SWR1 complex subunit 2 [Vitis vinifera]